MLKWPFSHYVRFFPLRWYGSITSKLAIGSWPLMMIVVQSYVTNSNSSKLVMTVTCTADAAPIIHMYVKVDWVKQA